MTRIDTKMAGIALAIAIHHREMTTPDRALTPTHGTTYRSLLDDLLKEAKEMYGEDLEKVPNG